MSKGTEYMVSWHILQKVTALYLPCERLLFGRLYDAVEEVIRKCEQACLPEQLVEKIRLCNWFTMLHRRQLRESCTLFVPVESVQQGTWVTVRQPSLRLKQRSFVPIFMDSPIVSRFG